MTRVWDLPIRAFHWALAVLVAFSFVSARIGGAWTDWHFRSGYAILALLVFRLFWGFAGSAYARFSSFDLDAAAAWRHLRGPSAATLGHSPAGALAIVLMLATLLLQAATGLFANDAIASEGPLARLVSSALSDRLTTVHRLGEKALIAQVVLHVGAIGYYWWGRRLDLLTPMITGDCELQGEPARDDMGLRLRAAALLALAAALVALVVTL